jgi:hypothetical protein
MKESCSRSKGPHTFMSLKASCSLKSPQLGPIRCQSGRGLWDHPGCWLPDSMPGVEAFNRRCGSIPQGSSKHPSHGQIVSTSQRRAVQVDEFSGHGVAQFFQLEDATREFFLKRIGRRFTRRARSGNLHFPHRVGNRAHLVVGRNETRR